MLIMKPSNKPLSVSYGSPCPLAGHLVLLVHSVAVAGWMDLKDLHPFATTKETETIGRVMLCNIFWLK